MMERQSSGDAIKHEIYLNESLRMLRDQACQWKPMKVRLTELATKSIVQESLGERWADHDIEHGEDGEKNLWARQNLCRD